MASADTNGGDTVIAFFVGVWSRPASVLMFSILRAYPGPVAAFSWGFFFVCTYEHFGFLASSAWRLRYMRQKKKLTTVFLPVSEPITLLLFTFQSPLTFFKYDVPRFLAVLSRRNREKYIYSIFPNMECLKGGDRTC